MERIRSLNLYQKVILVLLALLVAGFGVAYGVTVSRVGFLFRDAILVPAQEGSATIYTGKVEGEEAVFTVSADKTVTFRCAGKDYGTYTVTEDPTALPEDKEISQVMTGVEVCRDGQVLFRGGILHTGEDWVLMDENGELAGPEIQVTTNSGEVYVNGVLTDPIAPTATDILRLLDGPELTHKGEMAAWAVASFLAFLTAVSILFAPELFRWQLRFMIRNVEEAEPSDWEIAGRYIAWTVMTVAVLVLMIIGLG